MRDKEEKCWAGGPGQARLRSGSTRAEPRASPGQRSAACEQRAHHGDTQGRARDPQGVRTAGRRSPET